MTETSKTPLHLWIVGGLSLLWNCIGGLDYTMFMTRNAAYLAQVTPAQMAYLESFPAWANAAWAFGVWGALAGSILLLMRRRHAVTAFALSLAGLAASCYYRFVMIADQTAAAFGPGIDPITIAIWVIAIALLGYAWWARARGWLR